MKKTPEPQQNTLVGVISDTHGVLLPAASKALQGVDLIIHAGDIGDPDILKSLRSIAPVVAVRGNMDFEDGLWQLPATEAVEIESAWLYIVHDVHKLDIAPAESSFNAVIFGHSHRPSATKHDGVLFLNPGSAAQPRGGAPASLALLRISGASLTPQFVNLDQPDETKKNRTCLHDTASR